MSIFVKNLLMILTLSLFNNSYNMFSAKKLLSTFGGTGTRSLAYRAKDNTGRYCIGEIYFDNAKNTKMMVWVFESGKQEHDYWFKNERGSWVKLSDQHDLSLVIKKFSKK